MTFFYALSKQIGSFFSLSSSKEKLASPAFYIHKNQKAKKTSKNVLPYSPPKNDKLLQSKIANLVKNFNNIYPDLEPEVEFAWNSLPQLKSSFFKKVASFFSRTKTDPALSS